MKFLVALFALVVLAVNVAAYTDLQLVERSLCTADYQCKGNCVCRSPMRAVPKMCLCYSPHHRDRLERAVPQQRIEKSSFNIFTRRNELFV